MNDNIKDIKFAPKFFALALAAGFASGEIKIYKIGDQVNQKEKDNNANLNFQETLSPIHVRGSGVVGNGCFEWGPALEEPFMIAAGCDEILPKQGEVSLI